MNQEAKEYRLVPDHSSSHDHEGLLADYHPPTPRRLWPTPSFLLGALVLSLAWNFIFTLQFFRLGHGKSDRTQSISRYAGLANDLPLAWELETPYAPSNDNETLTDQLWESIPISPGIIALSDEFSGSIGLPRSQRFPWDPSQGTYLLNGYHSMHCLKNIRRAYLNARRGLPELRKHEHVLHCFDQLRQDVLCTADDTPRFSSGPNLNGIGQYRQCRDWNKLESWAKEHTACYGYVNETVEDFNEIERYKFCPDGSPYGKVMREYFGLPDEFRPSIFEEDSK